MASSQCRRPNAEASQAPNAYTLTSFGTHQGQAEARQSPSPTPKGVAWTGPLLADTVPAHWPFRPCLHSCPSMACLTRLALPPAPRAQSGQCRDPGWAQPICVCICVWCYLSSCPWPGAAHTWHARTRWAQDVAPELPPELDLMQTFLCLLGRGTSEGPGSKPTGLRATARRGAAPGFRHTTPTRARAHACLVCHPTQISRTHISCCTPGGHSRLSHPVSVQISLSHAALLPPTQGHPTAPPYSSPCPQPRGVLPDGACEYATGVPGWTMASVRAVVCPLLGPVV